jgi:hypothetical protein
MNLNAIKSAIKIAAVGALVLAASTATFRAKADERDKRTVVTINQPIQVTKTVLTPGTYVFSLLYSPWNQSIVQIYNADGQHLITTIMAMHNERLRPTGDSQFLFYETPAGSPRAVHAWFYPGDIDGQEFPYPKHLAMLTASVAAPAPTPTPAAAAAPAPAEPQAQAAPPPQEQAEVETNQTQIEVAQNNPPAQPEPAPAVETLPPPAVQEPASLPKTATPYPLFGIGGLLSFAAYGLLRITRVA